MKGKTIVGILLVFITGLPLAQVSAENEQLVLIGHEGVADALEKDDIRQIFMGKKTRWADGTKIMFVVFADKEAYVNFLKAYVGKTYSQYRNYWKKQVFTGKGRMPQSFENSDQLIRFVSGTAGAISFISADSIVAESSLKVLSIINRGKGGENL